MFKFKKKSNIDFLIVGLGNPGLKYDKTRHNVGFACVDLIAKNNNAGEFKKKFKGLVSEFSYNGKKVLLLKPQTFMNLSGESLIETAAFYKIDLSQILLIYDDIDVEVGAIKLKKDGSAAGHNGLKSIFKCAGTTEFKRVKIGVGAKPHPQADLSSHVLGKFKGDDVKKSESAIDLASRAAVYVVENGVEEAQNKYNRR